MASVSHVTCRGATPSSCCKQACDAVGGQWKLSPASPICHESSRRRRVDVGRAHTSAAYVRVGCTTDVRVQHAHCEMRKAPGAHPVPACAIMWHTTTCLNPMDSLRQQSWGLAHVCKVGHAHHTPCWREPTCSPHLLFNRHPLGKGGVPGGWCREVGLHNRFRQQQPTDTLGGLGFGLRLMT
jgi:hypothetical protein